MSQVEWQQVKEVFYTALSRPVVERSDFLDSACGNNRALRSEVEVLLDSYESGFLEDPLLAEPAKRSSSKPRFEQGHIFNHYKVLRLLGRGGMGEVYLANDTALDRLTAIKIIHSDSGFGDQAAGRLVREARAAAKLDHPNICSVFEVGETDGQPFIAMQYVEGEMLDALIERDSITFDDVVTYTRQIAAGLTKAHSWGIVHRDIKPSNIIVDSHKHLKILDFGLAKETLLNTTEIDVSAVGLIAGTVAYMSPEHVRGQEINEQTDIWSLGVVLYQMLTGGLPFRGETKADLIAAILHNDLEVPADLSRDQSESIGYVLRRALEKDRSKRYQTIAEFDADLAALATTGSARSNLVRHRFDRVVDRLGSLSAIPRRTRLPWRLATTAVMILALAGALVAIWLKREAHESSSLFAAPSSSSLQVSSLYDLKRQVGGAITDLSFSPDGEMITFSLSGNGASNVYVKQISGAEPLRVTDGKSVDYSPVWSPDGQRIAYVSKRDGKRGIWSVSHLSGTPDLLVELKEDRSGYHLVKWSHDGKRIFFEYGNGPKEIDLETGKISALDLTGIEGNIKRGLSLSHDESRFLAVSDENGTEQLWVKTLGQNDATRVHDTFPRNDMPQWFPDDRGVAYSADRNGNSQIYVRSLDGSTPRQMTFGNFNSTDPVVSPDGQRIVYVTSLDEANLFSIDIASRKENVLTTNVNMQMLPCFSPDGRRIAYQTMTDVAKLYTGLVKIDPYDQSEPTTKLSEPGCCAKWSPNGNEIAYLRRFGTELNIWKGGINGQEETQISRISVATPTNTLAPFDFHAPLFEWSPDASKVVFVSSSSGQNNVWTVNSDGSNGRMLTDFPDGSTKAVSPLWSSDGKRIAFIEAVGAEPAAYSRENRIAIYENNTITIAATFKSLASLLCWSNSGEGVYVAVSSALHNDIYFVSANGLNTVKHVLQLPNVRRFGIRISPDQKWVAYAERHNDTDNLYVIPLEGGRPISVTTNGDSTLFYSGVTWSPDSRALLYSKQTGGMQISLISQINEETHSL